MWLHNHTHSITSSLSSGATGLEHWTGALDWSTGVLEHWCQIIGATKKKTNKNLFVCLETIIESSSFKVLLR